MRHRSSPVPAAGRPQPVARRSSTAGLPAWISPQLTQLVDAPPDGDQWLHELKYDGYRMHARLDRGAVKLLTRTGLDWTHKYPSVAKAVAALKAREAYLDGELCGVGPDGITSFNIVQRHEIAVVLIYILRLASLGANRSRAASLHPRGPSPQNSGYTAPPNDVAPTQSCNDFTAFRWVNPYAIASETRRERRNTTAGRCERLPHPRIALNAPTPCLGARRSSPENCPAALRGPCWTTY
jgi:hypothetical protein